MLKKMNDLLSGLPMTIVGAVFLVISFLVRMTSFTLPVDPAWVTVVICGIPLLYLALWRIVYNPGISKISSALLISIAMVAAILIGDLFAAGEVAFIMALGAILEDRTTDRAKKGLKDLIDLTPATGRRLANGREEIIDAADIHTGDILRILPGETIPVDGVIIRGQTSVDQSVMTGESLPVDKYEQDTVFCGTLNRFGSIDIEAAQVGEDSSLQKLIRMVCEADQKQAPMQRLADKAASYLVPVALLIAIIAGIVQQDIIVTVTVMVVFCPCALVLATPTAIMAAIGQATKHGVIIKSGEALERMGKADTIAFDKTGTLTYGRLTVSDLIPLRAQSEEELLVMAASAECRSEHPLAKAVIACAQERGLMIFETEEFSMAAGGGVRARINGRLVVCGNRKFLQTEGMETDEEGTQGVQEYLDRFAGDGKAVILVADETGLQGILAFSDVLRPQSAGIIRRLLAMNTQVVLLTGDQKKAADYFAGQAGVRDVRAQLLPHEKVETVQEMTAQGRTVCMVGDGVNDAPALKTAAVGVAMGGMGSDLAVDAADIVLMSDDISRLPYLKRLADATVRTITCSITLSMCINFVAVTLSVLGYLGPTTGALVHNCGSCFVVLLAALLYDRRFDEAEDVNEADADAERNIRRMLAEDLRQYPKKQRGRIIS